MKTRDYKMYLEDILDAMDKIERYIDGLSYAEFIKNDIVVDAVMKSNHYSGKF